MIELYSGTPGSGKSLHTVHEIKTYLKLNKNVISTCNIDTDLCFLNFFQRLYVNKIKKKPKKIKKDKRADNFYYIDINDITPDYLYRFAAQHHIFGKEHQTIVILDECVSIFSPTVISDDKEKWNAWDTLFRKHRHIGYDLILIPQSKKLITRKVIAYCDFETQHFNRKHQGIFGFIFSLIVGGLFSFTKFWRGTKVAIDSGFFTYKPLYGLMYNSYSMFDETLKPFKDEIEREENERKELLSKLCFILNERSNQLAKEI